MQQITGLDSALCLTPFFDYQLPEAVLRFRQGFGRLIRSKRDRGLVVVLDSRITRKSYGRGFLKALPECKVVTHDGARKTENLT